MHGYGWPLNISVNLRIDDPDDGVVDIDYSETQTVGVADWDPANQTFVRFYINNFALEPGQIVTMTDGTVTKTHTITSLSVVSVNPDTDMVTGTAAPGSQVDNSICEGSTCANRRVFTGQNGIWTANFALPGEAGDDPTLFNIVPGSRGEARQSDADEDNTTMQWRVLSPFIEANPNNNWVHARDWPEGTAVTLTINNPFNGPEVDKTILATMGPADWNPSDILADFNLDGFNLEPLFILTVSGDIAGVPTVRSYALSSLAVTNFSLGPDTITGSATPNSGLQVCANLSNNMCSPRHLTASETGAWMADYGHAGAQGDEQQLVDLEPGSSGWAAEYDINGNQTWIDWRIRNPFIVANPGSNWVQARDWPHQATVTLTINDPSNGPAVDKEVSAFMGPAPWGNDNTLAEFDLQGFDLKPGFIVTVSGDVDGAPIVRSFAPTNLAVTGFNLPGDIITGIASPDKEVQLCANAQDNCIQRFTTSSGTGAWIADYAHPGTRNDEQQLLDLKPGHQGWAAEYDSSGNQTFADWWIKNPYINDIADQSTKQDTPTGAIDFTVDDDEAAPANLTVTAASSNTALVPDANIVLGGSGTNRTITLTPAAKQSGTTTITVTVDDGGSASIDTFVLTVNPVFKVYLPLVRR